MRGIPGLAVVAVVLSAAHPAAASSAAEPAGAAAADSLLTRYNAEISRALAAVESLWVEQTFLEPQDDGSVRRADAVLSYVAGGGVDREILRSELSHMYGEYTLQSLVGPFLEPSEYEVSLEGIEEQEGHECHRMAVEALVRDRDHFDGTVWISLGRPGPVRVEGTVADPPFPVTEIGFDKTFELLPCGLWMVRRHTAEVEVSLFGRRRGIRHIFYDLYEVVLAAMPDAENE